MSDTMLEKLMFLKCNNSMFQLISMAQESNYNHGVLWSARVGAKTQNTSCQMLPGYSVSTHISKYDSIDRNSYA